MDNVDIGAIVLAVGTLIASIGGAWLTARGAKNSAHVQAKPALEGSTNARIELLIEAYRKDRVEDSAEIENLKRTVKQQGQEIDDLKARLPRYRAAMRKLRHMVEALGGDPGPWPEGLD